MNEEKYANNSYSSKIGLSRINQPKKNEELVPVASGTEKKKTITEQLAESFIASNMEDMKRSLIFDWVIPGAKNIIEAMVHMLLFGNGSPSSSGRSILGRSSGESRLRKVDIYHNGSSGDVYIQNKVSREPEITYPTKEQADRVLLELRKRLTEYHRVTVKDFYTLSNIQQTDFAMANWGWRYLPEILQPLQVRGGGWVLKMPRTEEMR